MLTPFQINNIRQAAGASPLGTNGQPQTSLSDKLGIVAPTETVNPTPVEKTNPLTDVINNTGKDYADAIPNFAAEAGKNDNSTSGNPIIRTGENALAATMSGIGTVFAPLGEAIKGIHDFFNKNPNSVGNFAAEQTAPIADNLKALADAHPEAARNLSNIINLGLTVVGKEGLDKPLPTIGEIKTAAENASGKIINAADATKTAVKEAITPTPTVAEAAGQVAQGTAKNAIADAKAIKDVVSSKVVDPNGNVIAPAIDTTGIKTHQDFVNTLDTNIKSASETQTANLSSDTKTYKLNSLETKTGSGKATVSTNYVKQAINDLKQYFAKTNDATGLAKINQIAIDAKNNGMTVNQINELAKLHGQTINAFNANGEAASGLTKQAAENTRSGLKQTFRSRLPDETSKLLDQHISKLYDAKAIAERNVGKVTAHIQNTPKQGIVPKVVSKVIKTVDTLAGSPLKTIGKEMGNIGVGKMTPLELEANLNKNLEILKNDPSIKNMQKVSEKINKVLKDNGVKPLSPVKGRSKGTLQREINARLKQAGTK